MDLTWSVAPLAGSVDRNNDVVNDFKTYVVAPLAGSVDRNSLRANGAGVAFLSLPSRGAWIEIYCDRHSGNRNESLPSRGAWIEINSPRL